MTSSKPQAALASSYIAHLAGERRLSPLTCKAYARDITVLLNFAETTSVGQLQVHHIRRFIAQLHGKGFSGRSLARMLSAWRGFYNTWLGITAISAIHAPEFGRQRRPKNCLTLSPDEAAKLLDFPVENDLMALRDKAMFELCYSSGLRLAELTDLRPEDMDFFEGTVRVTGKGSKTRIVPVGSKAADVREWIKRRELLVRPGQFALFCPGTAKISVTGQLANA